jgi:hypothetical protein
MKCEKCKKEKVSSEFMPSTGYLWPNGHINICYDCIEVFIDGNNLNEVDRLCQHANMAFLPNEWRKIWKRDGTKAFKKYAHMYNEINYYKYDWGTQNEKLAELARAGVIATELDELKPELIAKLKLAWGDLPELDLIRVERFFNASLSDYNVQTEAQKDMLRKIARLSVLIDEDLSNGLVDKDKITQYDKLMTSALKTLETTQQSGITSIGQVIEFIEKNGYKPRFYEGVPRDEIDMIEKNIQEYLKDLVQGEVNLTDIYERKRQEKNMDEDGELDDLEQY